MDHIPNADRCRRLGRPILTTEASLQIVRRSRTHNDIDGRHSDDSDVSTSLDWGTRNQAAWAVWGAEASRSIRSKSGTAGNAGSSIDWGGCRHEVAFGPVGCVSAEAT